MTDQSGSSERKALLKNALLRINELQAKLDVSENALHEPIAIIGMSCRFPGGASDLEKYWDVLHDGVDAIRPVPPERWDASTFDHLPLEKPIAWYGGFLDQIDHFDPQFFNISPREANTMDPQQRMVLEVAWEALENAGITADQVAGSQTGIFVGVTTSDYAQLLRYIDPMKLDIYAATGSALNAVAGRVAYTLGLHGPSISVDTACSSSLVAIHLACQSLRKGESSIALTGGVNAILTPEAYISFARWGMMAPDARCKTFDSAADGFVRGEGAGMLVLKRLSSAQADGDRILAVIRGTAVNNDGRSSGLTVPNGRAQEAVVRAALKDGGIVPGQVAYVEAHGTGTSLGDPIEIEALGRVLGEGRPDGFPLILSSAKTNLGHLESASGIAGLIKVVLSLRHAEIPPHLHLKERSPRILWPDFPVEIPTEPRPWPAGDQPRIAGVSSFGFSGTNAHIVIEEAPQQPELRLEEQFTETSQPVQLLVLSGKTAPALTAQAGRYAEYLSKSDDSWMTNICRTAAVGRTPMNYRLSITGTTREDIQNALNSFVAGESSKGSTSGQPERSGQGKIAFLFTGQGSQWADMGKQLYEKQPVFRQALDLSADLLYPYLQESLISILFPTDKASSLLDNTRYTQPALFALEYALVKLWQSWGIKPYAVLGHSVGEYAAACAAGVFSLEDGLKLIASRAQLMGSLPMGGQMVAVFASEAMVSQVLTRCNVPVSIAANNGPESVVISGGELAIAAVVEQLQLEGIQTRPMNVSHAFHSPLMDPILNSFEQTAREIEYHTPSIRVISNVTGQPESEMLTSPAYWRRHIRMPVRFYEGIQSLYAQGCRIFVEIGPHPVLIGMANHCLTETMEPTFWQPSLRKNTPDLQQIFESLGSLWVRGVSIDWAALYKHIPTQLVDLPTYPFQRQHYWLEMQPELASRRQPASSDQIHPLLGQQVTSPLLKEKVYQTRLWIDQPAFLNDHRLYGTAIFPGTGYLEIGQAVAALLYPDQPVSIENVSIINLLNIPEDDEKTIQVILSAAQNGNPARFKVFSLNVEKEETWTLHTEGAIVPQVRFPIDQDDLLTKARAACQTEINGNDFYQLFDTVWFAYGPSFKCIQKIWRKDFEAVGELALPDQFAADAKKYILHPGLLDACIQLLGAAIPNMERELNQGIFYAPVSIRNYQIQLSGCSQVTAYTRLEPLSGSVDTMIGTIWLYDQSGAQVGVVEELILRKVTREMVSIAINPENVNDLYRLNWVETPLPEKHADTKNLMSRWVVLTGDGEVGQTVAQALMESDQNLQVYPASEARKVISDEMQRSMFSSQEGVDQHFRGVIYLAGSKPEITLSTDHLRDIQKTVLGGLVHTGQMLIDPLPNGSRPPMLVIVTQGAQAILPNESVPALPQASVWGMGRAIANEHPELRCVCIDLDPQADFSEAVQYLYESLHAIEMGEVENQLSFRSNHRYAPRLERMTESAGDAKLAADNRPDSLTDNAAYKLIIKERGVLDDIELHPVAHPELDPNQVEIQVMAAGLNFRDVLNVLGMLPDASDDLGHECAGIITAVGNEVTRHKVGDEVMGIATGSFASYVATHQDLVIRKPDWMSFIDAATIPITFLTTHFAMVHLGKLKKGERVLIHSAAGGVGMAAIQIAMRAGAEIYATAGSEEKRKLLESIGIPFVMDSRTLKFADQIMDFTKGEGVDMVLNALTDDFLMKSFAVLKPGGRFLEIGKRGILSHEQVQAMQKNYEYHIVFLGEVCIKEPGLIQEMLQALVEEFSHRVLQPLQSSVFAIENAADAFRYMAHARHIGKIVLTLPANQNSVLDNPKPHNAEVSSSASYLITGGLGGIGLKTAHWLASKGAGSLVLVSRGQPTEDNLQQLEQIRTSGTQVTVIAGDISCEEDVLRILNEINSSLPPLRGIFHAAGWLEDTSFSELDWSKVDRVLAPKVYGAWNLHINTLDLPLDFFVLFSAGAAVFGSVGQANYASANAYLDSLAHYRRARGLTALSINWGPWAEVGMAARSSKALQNQWTKQGVQLMAPDACFQAMEKLINSQVTQAVVIKIDWPTFLSQFPVDKRPPFLLNLFEDHTPAVNPARESQSPANLLQQLFNSKPEQRKNTLIQQIKTLVGQVTGVKNPDQIQSSYSLVELGIDSLMIVELRNRIKQAYHVDIPLGSLFKFPSLLDLIDQLASMVLTTEVITAETSMFTGDREEIDL